MYIEMFDLVLMIIRLLILGVALGVLAMTLPEYTSEKRPNRRFKKLYKGNNNSGNSDNECPDA